MSFSVRRPFHRFVSSRDIRWRERFILFLLFLGSVLIESSLSSAIRLPNFRPDLLLITVVYWSLKKGPGSGFYAGFSAGLIGDIFSAGMLGLSSICLGVTGILVAFGSRPLYRGHFSTRIVMVVLGTVLSGFLYYLLLLIFSQPPPWTDAWKESIRPGIWQTVLISPLWLWVSAKVLG